jgi:cytochrome c
MDLNTIKGFTYLYSANRYDGFIEVRIDSRAGPVISKIPFEKTSETDKVLNATLDKPVAGKHDIYFFVLQAGKPDNNGIINLKQISFQQ